MDWKNRGTGDEYKHLLGYIWKVPSGFQITIADIIIYLQHKPETLPHTSECFESGSFEEW